MSAVPIERYLTDFEVDAPNGARRRPENPAVKLERAYAEGFESGRQAAQAASEAKSAEQQARWEAHLASERERWTRNQGDRMADGFATAIRELESRIGEAAARALAPFLEDSVRRRAIAELAERVRGLIAKEAGVVALAISGPDDLTTVVHQALAPLGCAVEVTRAEAGEVRVVIDETLLETRIAPWAASIREALQ